MKIKSKLIGAFSIIVGVTIILGIIVFISSTQIDDQFEFLVEHDLNVLQNAQKLQKLVVDAETGQRGFIITGQEDFLEPYYNGINGFDELIQVEKELVSDNPSQVQKLENIQVLFNEWKLKAAEPEIKAARDYHKSSDIGSNTFEFSNVAQLLKNKTGKNILDQIRNEFTIFIQIENDLKDKRFETVSALEPNTQNSVFVFSIASIVIGTLVSIFLFRSINTPIIRLKESSERIGKDEYVQLEVSGNDELTDLTRSFNNMATNILQSKITIADNLNSIKNEKDKLAFFKLALDESTIAAITDKEGIITYANKKFEEISKYTALELIGQNHRILKSGYHPPEFYKDIWDTISSGKIWKGDIKNIAKDGSIYWVKTVITPFLDENGEPKQYMAIRMDITKQKELDEKLNAAYEELKESDVLREEFASMVTHELKTPLTPIKGYCEMLQDKSFGTLTETQQDYVKKINSSAELLERLIGDVLDVQKLDMSRMQFNIVNIDIDAFLDKLKQDSESLMRIKGIEFFVTDSLKISIKTDELRLHQILDNLIRNSVDFVPSRNGKIEVVAKQENGKMIFSVKDNGVGIPKDKQKNIFKKFYQVDTSHTRKHGGSGLGLVICKGIVDGLGGEMWFESEPGKGTTFSFDMPLDGN